MTKSQKFVLSIFFGVIISLSAAYVMAQVAGPDRTWIIATCYGGDSSFVAIVPVTGNLTDNRMYLGSSPQNAEDCYIFQSPDGDILRIHFETQPYHPYLVSPVQIGNPPLRHGIFRLAVALLIGGVIVGLIIGGVGHALYFLLKKNQISKRS